MVTRPARRAGGILVLASGGLDSAALLAQAARQDRRVQPVFVRQGLRWETVEQFWLRRFLAAAQKRAAFLPLVTLTLPMRDVYGTHWSLEGQVPGARTRDEAVYLPGRNLVLTVKAAVVAAMRGFSRLWIGTLAANPFPDASTRALALWSAGLSKALATPLRVEAPFRRSTKAELLRRFADWPLHLSFSCLNPQGRRHCGRCNKCAERRRAFRDASVRDKTRYA